MKEEPLESVLDRMLWDLSGKKRKLKTRRYLYDKLMQLKDARTP